MMRATEPVIVRFSVEGQLGRAGDEQSRPPTAATSVAGSEAVLPAYLVGMALAPTFLSEPELPHSGRSRHGLGSQTRSLTTAKYTVLVTAVIGSIVAPTLITQRWFSADVQSGVGSEVEEAEAVAGEEP